MTLEASTQHKYMPHAQRVVRVYQQSSRLSFLVHSLRVVIISPRGKKAGRLSIPSPGQARFSEPDVSFHRRVLIIRGLSLRFLSAIQFKKMRGKQIPCFILAVSRASLLFERCLCVGFRFDLLFGDVSEPETDSKSGFS